MADVYRAFQFLNESLNLNLSDDQLAMAERAMKQAWAAERNHSVSDPDDWEFLSHLVPRAGDKAAFPAKLKVI